VWCPRSSSNEIEFAVKESVSSSFVATQVPADAALDEILYEVSVQMALLEEARRRRDRVLTIAEEHDAARDGADFASGSVAHGTANRSLEGCRLRCQGQPSLRGVAFSAQTQPRTADPSPDVWATNPDLVAQTHPKLPVFAGLSAHRGVGPKWVAGSNPALATPVSSSASCRRSSSSGSSTRARKSAA
jgi:hypothetical protein